MNKIIGEQLGGGENEKTKHFSIFLKEVLNTVGIKRLGKDISLKNDKFIELLSLYKERIRYVSTDLELYGYEVKNMFFIEDEDYIKYLRLNISKIKSGELLIGFLYDDPINALKIKSIVFAKQVVEDSVINDNLEFFRDRLKGIVIPGIDC
ncbi:MAG: hypothetical protein PHH98_03375 [Candidatus Gracilibacteria bacterium]|nr:hypothetical protein [Candidatus Gracilibacteria bacterium]